MRLWKHCDLTLVQSRARFISRFRGVGYSSFLGEMVYGRFRIGTHLEV